MASVTARERVRRQPARRRDRVRRMDHHPECDRARPDRRAARRSRAPRARARHPSRGQQLRGRRDMADLQPARARVAVPADPDARERVAGRGRRARQRLPRLVALVDRDRTGRGRSAHPCRRPADPDPQASRRDGVQHDVGAHRLHGCERSDAARAGQPRRRSLAGVRRAVRHDPRGDGRGQRARLARIALARRRREHHRPAAGRHRDELLRGVDPPAGEPAARDPAGDRGRVLAAAARALWATASTAGSSGTSTSTTRPICSTQPVPRGRWCGIAYDRPRGATRACSARAGPAHPTRRRL